MLLAFQFGDIKLLTNHSWCYNHVTKNSVTSLFWDGKQDCRFWQRNLVIKSVLFRFIGLLRLNLGFRRLADWNPSVKSRRRKDQSTPGTPPPSVQVSQKRSMAVPEINYQKLAEELLNNNRNLDSCMLLLPSQCHHLKRKETTGLSKHNR